MSIVDESAVSALAIPLAYSLVTALATLFGGGLPLYTRLQRIEGRYLIAFAGAPWLPSRSLT